MGIIINPIFDYFQGNFEVDSTERGFHDAATQQETQDDIAYIKRVIKNLEEFPDMQKKVRFALNNDTVQIVWRNIHGLRGNYNRRTKIITLNSAYWGKEVVVGILLHELIHHVQDGTELDAEFFENRCCTYYEGALRPSSDDFDKFYSNGAKHVFIKSMKRKRVVVVYQGVQCVFQKGNNPIFTVLQ